MKKIIHILSIAYICSCTLFISAATVLEKQLEIGKDPKTKKMLVAKGYAFVEGKSVTEDTRWICVYPYEKELYVFSLKNNEEPEIFSVSYLIAAQQTSEIILDPSTGKQATQEAIRAGKSLLTIHVYLDAHVQIFREIVILIAKNDTKSLSALINKHPVNVINDIIERAVDCQCECIPLFDEAETIENILEQAVALKDPLSFTGKIIFLPIHEIAQEFLQMAQEQQKA